jgi:hypothetical protein
MMTPNAATNRKYCIDQSFPSENLTPQPPLDKKP